MLRTLVPLALVALTTTILLPLASAQVGKNDKILNPNLATKEQLATVGLEKETKAIVEARPFKSIVEFDKLLAKTQSAEARKKLYEKLFVPINLNTATREEIFLIPRMGKKMAHEFEEYRPYKHLKQFRREIAKYVDKKELARLEQYVFVPLELNTAKEEEFKSIPGVGKRMAHEFVEYRPYKSMKQFRREIGKYVDKKEVARLERYIFLKGASSKPATSKPKRK